MRWFPEILQTRQKINITKKYQTWPLGPNLVRILIPPSPLPWTRLNQGKGWGHLPGYHRTTSLQGMTRTGHTLPTLGRTIKGCTLPPVNRNTQRLKHLVFEPIDNRLIKKIYFVFYDILSLEMYLLTDKLIDNVPCNDIIFRYCHGSMNSAILISVIFDGTLSRHLISNSPTHRNTCPPGKFSHKTCASIKHVTWVDVSFLLSAGVGYHMVMVKNDECNVETVTGAVNKFVPDAKLESNISPELSYILPRESSHRFEVTI